MTKLHLLEAPLQFSDSVRAFEADVEETLSRKALIVGLTEVAKRHKALLRLGRVHGYTVVQPDDEAGNKVGTALLIKQDENVEILKEWWIPAIPAKEGLPRKGGHGPRGWTCVRAVVDGETVFVGQGHLITAGQTPDDGERFKQNKTMLRKGVAVLKREARGSRVGFLMGDMNTPDSALDVEGMTSIWEGRKRPADPVCTILTFDADKRATVTRIRRWPLQKSDHAPFSAWVDIAEKQKQAAKTTPAAPVPDDEPSNVTQLDSRRSTKKAAAKRPAKKAAATTPAPAPAPEPEPTPEPAPEPETESAPQPASEPAQQTAQQTAKRPAKKKTAAKKALAKKRAPRKTVAKKVAETAREALSAV